MLAQLLQVHLITQGGTEDARLIYPRVIVLPPDPAKYRYVHVQLRTIFRTYSADVTPKSIDEAVIDFTHVQAITSRSLQEIGLEIKERMKNEIGVWMRCNVGIGTNRFLAKLVASLHKPDGLDTITHENLRDVYTTLPLIDLCGISFLSNGIVCTKSYTRPSGEV